MHIWLVTTFPNSAWALYAKEALLSLIAGLPAHIKICVGLDDAALEKEVKGLFAGAGRVGEVKVGWQPDHQEFVARNKQRDHASEYRLQATRFCHKVFVLKYFMDKARAAGADYLIWWDGDALLTRPVAEADLAAVLPRADEACSYLGRTDWDHSECGFMGFNMAHEGAARILDFMHLYYVQGLVFSLPQWHDSYLFDVARKGQLCRNLSEGVPGNNVWAATALGAFSEHRKGEEAKLRGKALTDGEFYT